MKRLEQTNGNHHGMDAKKVTNVKCHRPATTVHGFIPVAFSCSCSVVVPCECTIPRRSMHEFSWIFQSAQQSKESRGLGNDPFGTGQWTMQPCRVGEPIDYEHDYEHSCAQHQHDGEPIACEPEL